MAILSRDEFFRRINEQLGDSHDDGAISFLEDMTDTYGDLERRVNNSDSEELRRRLEENDAAWRARYANRFFTGTSRLPDDVGEPEKKDASVEDVTFDNIFSRKEEC